MRFPFLKAKDRAPPPSTKSASFVVGTGAGSYLATKARYNDLATEGYAWNSIANACINRIATSVSSVEPQLYRKTKGGKLEKIETHPLLDLLANPNPAQSGKEFTEWLVSYFYVAGNTYIFKNTGLRKGIPTELQLLNPGKVQVQPGDGIFPRSYEYRPNPNQAAIRYDVDQVSGECPVLQLKTFNPLDPWNGLAPMLAAAFGIDIFNSGNKWNKRLLDNDARPSGALVVKNADGTSQALTDEQYQRLKEMIDQQMSGGANAGKPILLEGGLDWKEMSVNPKDLDFLSGKNSAASDIGLVFGVPSQLLGIEGSSTFANYEQAMLAFWTDTVIPRLCFILEAYNRWLTPLYGDDLFLWYDEEMIPALEPRRKEKADRINAANYLTIDEKRQAMGYDSYKPSKEPGGVLLVPTTDIPLDLAGDQGLSEPGSPQDENDERPDIA